MRRYLKGTWMLNNSESIMQKYISDTSFASRLYGTNDLLPFRYTVIEMKMKTLADIAK